MQEARSLAPGDAFFEAWLGWANALAGAKDKALATLDGLERRRRETYTSAALIAVVHLALGGHDKAIDWLSTALDERDFLFACARVWPTFDPLRSDPRFQALLQRMNFPKQPQS